MLRNGILHSALFFLVASAGCGGVDSYNYSGLPGGKAETVPIDGVALGQQIAKMVQEPALVIRSQANNATAQDPVHKAPLSGVGSKIVLDAPLDCTDKGTLALLHKALRLPHAQVAGFDYDNYFTSVGYGGEFFLLYTSPETAGSEPQALGFSELHDFYEDHFDQICILDVWPAKPAQTGEVYIVGRTPSGAIAGAKAENIGTLYIPPHL